MMRAAGIPYSRFEQEQGLLLTVVEAHLDYVAPARYDDELEIRSEVAEVRRVRLRIDTEVRRVATCDVVCRGWVWLACVTRESRPVALPTGVAEALAPPAPRKIEAKSAVRHGVRH